MSEKTNQISFGYSVIRSKRKTVTISINPVKGVIVRAPKNFRQVDLVKFIKKHETEILNALEKNTLSPQSFENGSHINYLGFQFTIVHKAFSTVSEPFVFIENDNLIVNYSLCTSDIISKGIEDWFIAEAVRILAERSEILMEQVGVKPTKITFRSQKTRWGSCSSKGSISLNWKLIFAPLEVIDYVIIHEMCHMHHMDHSKKFWEKVSQFDPNYKENKKWLKKNANLVYWPFVER